MSGRTAFVTAAGETPARRAISARVTGPWESTMVKICGTAGVWAGNASGRVVRMAGNLRFILFCCQ